MAADKFAEYRRIARETIDPEARAAIIGLITMVMGADAATDRLREKISRVGEQIEEML